MNAPWARGGSLLLGLGIGLWPIGAGGQPLVEFPRGPLYEIPADATPVVSIPVRPLADKALVPVVLDVAQGDMSTPHLSKALVPVFVSRQGASFLDITLDANAVSAPATYSATIEISAAGTRQTAQIKLVKPAAVLAPLPTLRIVQTLPFLTGQPKIAPARLELQELSGRSRLTDLMMHQTGSASSADLPVSGRLVSNPPQPVAIEPNHGGFLPLELDGEFPPGLCSGTVQIWGRQLAAPVSASFEVRTRRSAAWIPILIALGLAVGAFLRVWLANTAARRQAAVRSAELEVQMTARRARVPDKTFRERVDRLLVPLRFGREEEQPETIDSATKRTLIELEKASEALEARATAVRQRIGRLNVATSGAPFLYPFSHLTPVIEGWIAALDAAVARDDVGGAEISLEEHAAQLVAYLGTSNDAWHRYLEALGATQFPGVGKDLFPNHPAALKMLFGFFPPAAPAQTHFDRLLELLPMIRDRQKRLSNWTDAARTALTSYLATWRTAISERPPERHEKANLLCDQVEELLRTVTNETFLGVLPDLAKRVAAIQDATLAREARPFAPPSPLVPAAQDPPAPSIAAASNGSTEARPDAGPADPASTDEVARAAQRARRHVVRQAARVEVLRWVLASAALTTLSYWFYADSFVGTARDMATILGAALATDATADRVVEAIKKFQTG